MAALSAQRVEDTLKAVLFTDDEAPTNDAIPEDAIRVDGVISRYAFHPSRLEEKRGDICDMLADLPDDFHAEKGGGMSFLNACMDRHGRHWGEHRNIEQLLVLGIGTGAATMLFPREFWPALPGGMPYFQVSVGEAA